MQQEKKLELLKKHFREYFKDSFPAERLEKVVNQALCIKEETEAIMKAMDEYAAMQHPGGAMWVKCSDRLPEMSSSSKLIIVKRYEAAPDAYGVKAMTAAQLLDLVKFDLATFEWLDEIESPSKEGNKEQEVDGLSLLKFISEIGWGSVGGGEFINHNNGRIIKEQTLLKEFNEWDNQQKEGMK